MAGAYCRTKADTFGTLLRLPFTRSAQERQVKKEALELLAFVGLDGYAERLGSDLVWVECQQLQIARALASQPQLLLLDEPSSGMGSKETDKIANIVRQIRNFGITVILVTHDVKLVVELSDKISVINFGEKIAEGPPSQVLRDERVIEIYLGGKGRARLAGNGGGAH